VTGTLGTINRSDGGRQVTYNGVPLYRFAQDAAAGDTKGQGADGVWYLAGTNASAASGTITGGLGQAPGAATSAPTTASSAAPTPASTGGAANFYQIRSKAFPSITVVEGSTVTWTNADTGEHTVTADDGSFDSGKIAPGSTFQRTFQAAAAVKYHCSVDLSMTGTVNVTSIYNY
jgi:plastocyanin